MRLLLQWIVMAAAVGITAYVLPGVRISGAFAALIAALVLALVNTLLRPLLLVLTLPLNILTFGLFTFVVNALLVLLASAVVPGFLVSGFWWAVLFAIILAIVNAFLRGAVRAAA
ncbi:phage holin family protein [Candidatus Uhrbacteria bacterium]|nr:phage holin family protein [Candidatus Uhrbacteria bacterium]